MGELKDRWNRWKAKHWDEQVFFEDKGVPWLGFDRPPLRMAWEDHKHWIKPASKWLLALIGGALILKALGL